MEHGKIIKIRRILNFIIITLNHFPAIYTVYIKIWKQETLLWIQSSKSNLISHEALFFLSNDVKFIKHEEEVEKKNKEK